MSIGSSNFPFSYKPLLIRAAFLGIGGIDFVL